MVQQTVKITTTTAQSRQKKAASQYWIRRLAPILTIIGLITIWQFVVMLELYPRFIIPAPADVLASFLDVAADGTLLTHIHVTLNEVLVGLALGSVLAVVIGYLFARSSLLNDLLSPVIVALQATPVVAYAPLLIIWFGSGMTSKVVTTAIIVFFPMLMNVVVGLRNVPGSLRELMRMLNASRLQMFLKLEVPAALPVLLTGLKTGATLAVIGAVVGEFVSASAGLGFLVVSARSRFDTPLVIVAVLTLTAMALFLYVLISVAEWFLLRWQRRSV